MALSDNLAERGLVCLWWGLGYLQWGIVKLEEVGKWIDASHAVSELNRFKVLKASVSTVSWSRRHSMALCIL